MDYLNKYILAPMVRVGTLPMRLLALDYGADIVYSDEIIDFKLLKSKRVVNEVLGTIDYVWNGDTVIFRTSPREKKNLVLQMGTADGKRALKVALRLQQDVSVVDINMGCPKAFSIQGGMGAALLTQPEKIKEILTTLVNGLDIPVSCKIRILPSIEDTVALAKLIESTGVVALTVHGRLRDERPQHKNHNEYIREVAKALKIPVIANGGSKDNINCYEDLKRFQDLCGSSGVMIARSAMWNPSIFSKNGMLEIDEVIKSYLKYAAEYENNFHNTKYCVQQMLHNELDTKRGKALQASAILRDIFELWDMVPLYESIQLSHREKSLSLSECNDMQPSQPKRRKLDDNFDIVEMKFHFVRKEYEQNLCPKFLLNEWTKKNSTEPPKYETIVNEEGSFNTVVLVNGMKYASTCWEKKKTYSQNAAAAVCLRYMDIPDGHRDNPVVSSS